MGVGFRKQALRSGWGRTKGVWVGAGRNGKAIGGGGVA